MKNKLPHSSELSNSDIGDMLVSPLHAASRCHGRRRHTALIHIYLGVYIYVYIHIQRRSDSFPPVQCPFEMSRTDILSIATRSDFRMFDIFHRDLRYSVGGGTHKTH